MLFPSTYTWKTVKDAPNHVPMNTIGLSHTSREILEYGDVPILLMVLITPDSLQLTMILPVSNYPTSTLRLIQYVNDRIFSASVRHIYGKQDDHDPIFIC